MSLEEKLLECRGSQVFKETLVKLMKDDTMIVTFYYIVEKTIKPIEGNFTLRFQILGSGELTINNLRETFLSIIKKHITPLFCRNVRFPHIRFRLSTSNSSTKLLLGEIYGGLDEIATELPLKMKTTLSSGRKQWLKLFGISRFIMNWDQQDGIYTDCILTFNRLVQRNIQIYKDISIRVRGFHHLTRTQNPNESVIGIEPLGFIEKGIKPKNSKKKDIYITLR